VLDADDAPEVPPDSAAATARLARDGLRGFQWRGPRSAAPEHDEGTTMTLHRRTGGCLCGAVRYRVDAEPVISRICWCRDCQHLSSNGTVNAIFPSASIEVSGTPSEYASIADSGQQVRRRFCANCGAHLFADSTAAPG
jgi:hypothetical protein